VTISQNDQLENIGLAFRLILVELGDRAISEMFFDPHAASFKDVLATTWKELCDQRWLEEREIYGHAHYRLTGSGWMESLFRGGEGERPELRDSASKLSTVLKAHVKGRREDVTVELSRLAHESGLSPAWVSNAIESNLLETLHRRRGVQWVDRGTLVKIPLNFGMELSTILRTSGLSSKKFRMNWSTRRKNSASTAARFARLLLVLRITMFRSPRT
jgi:hypothetical protein